MKEADKIRKNAPGKLRKKLTPEQFHVTQEHGTREGLQSSLLKGQARRHVSLRRLWRAAVQLRYENSIRAQAGPSFSNAAAEGTIPTACGALKCGAPIAARISAMSSLTGLAPQVYATASMAARSTSTLRARAAHKLKA